LKNSQDSGEQILSVLHRINLCFLCEIPGLLDEPLTDSDLQSSVSDVDYTQEEVLILEDSDNGDLFKGYLNTALVLNYKAFDYQLEGLNEPTINKIKQILCYHCAYVTSFKINEHLLTK
jgi:hypothetical protein